MPGIKCSVTECRWNKEVMCQAPMVQIDRNGTSKADSSDQTKCETFKMK